MDHTLQSSGTVLAVVFPVYDAHGNNVATLSRNGLGYQISNRRSFDAWGSVRLGAQTGDPTGRYCANLGHKQDDESGLIYMRARYYEPTSGRFVSQDPAMDGDNWFLYCRNDPVGCSDPSGNWESDEEQMRRTSLRLSLAQAALSVATIVAGALVSRMARAIALSHLCFFAQWFNVLRDDEGLFPSCCSSWEYKVQCGLLGTLTYGLVGTAVALDLTPNSTMPGNQIVGICMEHAGFLGLFMALEQLCEGN